MGLARAAPGVLVQGCSQRCPRNRLVIFKRDQVPQQGRPASLSSLQLRPALGRRGGGSRVTGKASWGDSRLPTLGAPSATWPGRGTIPGCPSHLLGMRWLGECPALQALPGEGPLGAQGRGKCVCLSVSPRRGVQVMLAGWFAAEQTLVLVLDGDLGALRGPGVTLYLRDAQGVGCGREAAPGEGGEALGWPLLTHR